MRTLAFAAAASVVLVTGLACAVAFKAMQVLDEGR
jgi:hypothetical protein